MLRYDLNSPLLTFFSSYKDLEQIKAVNIFYFFWGGKQNWCDAKSKRNAVSLFNSSWPFLNDLFVHTTLYIKPIQIWKICEIIFFWKFPVYMWKIAGVWWMIFLTFLHIDMSKSAWKASLKLDTKIKKPYKKNT